uniref:TetR/AcrR family transcriptional regulator n=1 Tax=Sinimarinibacterium flocculans TaxID=985250 RepID=UPI0035173BAE
MKTALLSAANDLFGRRGPDAVSVRDVAALAKVNHALVHRHFGTKEKLLQLVMEDHAAAFRDAVHSCPDAAAAAEVLSKMRVERPAFVKIVAHLILSGRPAREFARHDGGIAALASKSVAEREDGGRNAKLDVISAVALILGVGFFAPFLVEAANYEGDQESVSDHALKIVGQLLGRPTRHRPRGRTRRAP